MADGVESKDAPTADAALTKEEEEPMDEGTRLALEKLKKSRGIESTRSLYSTFYGCSQVYQLRLGI